MISAESGGYKFIFLYSNRYGYNASAIEAVTPPPHTVFWFGHAETILPLVAKLGMFNESVATEHGGGFHLTADGFPSRLRRLSLNTYPVPNLFRSSHIIPFAANIAFYLFYDPVIGGGLVEAVECLFHFRVFLPSSLLSISLGPLNSNIIESTTCCTRFRE